MHTSTPLALFLGRTRASTLTQKTLAGGAPRGRASGHPRRGLVRAPPAHAAAALQTPAPGPAPKGSARPAVPGEGRCAVGDGGHGTANSQARSRNQLCASPEPPWASESHVSKAASKEQRDRQRCGPRRRSRMRTSPMRPRPLAPRRPLPASHTPPPGWRPGQNSARGAGAFPEPSARSPARAAGLSVRDQSLVLARITPLFWGHCCQ